MWNSVRRRRGRGLAGVAVASGIALGAVAAPAGADTSSGSVGFDAPVFVDANLGGGEPSVIYDPRASDYIYTAHEGTTHTLHDGIGGAPASTAIWAAQSGQRVDVPGRLHLDAGELQRHRVHQQSGYEHRVL